MFIAFPLIVVGMDRIIKNKGYALYVLSTAWVATAGMPFVVYTVPFVVVFAIIRVYYCYKGHFWKNLGKYFLRGSLFTVLALCMTGVPLYIFFTDYFTGMRVSDGIPVDIAQLLIPSFEYFKESFISFSSDNPTGVAGIIMICLMYIVTSYSAKKEEKTFCVVMMLLVVSPFIRYGLNVFQYDICRWGFVTAALICFNAVSSLPKLLHADKTERRMFLFVMAVYVLSITLKTKAFPMLFMFAMILVNAVPALRSGFIKLVNNGEKALVQAYRKKSKVLLITGAVIFFALIIAVVVILGYKHYVIIESLLIAAAVVVAIMFIASIKDLKAFSSVLLIASILVSGIFHTSNAELTSYKVQSAYRIQVASGLEKAENTFDRTANFTNDCVILKLDRTDELFGSNEEITEQETAPREDDKYIYYEDDPYINNALRYGIAEPTVFKSNVNGDFMRFMRRCGQDALSLYSQVDTGGFSGKEVMYSLFGVDKGYSQFLCEDFYGIPLVETCVSEDEEYIFVYENKYALPAGVTYDRFSGEKEFLSYNPAELPFAMMDSIYLEGYETSAYNGRTYSSKCDFSLKQESRGVTSFDVECFDNYINIESDISGCFLYINFEGVRAATYEDSRHDVFSIDMGDRTYNYYIHNSNGNWPWQYSTDSYTLSLGFQKENPGEIYFIAPFEFETVTLYAVPEEVYISAYEDRTAEILENVEVSTNTVTGDITVSSDKVLSVNMLYSKGWTAYVDGEKTPVYKANGLFLGIPLTAGSHNIKLVYRSPGFYEGIALSVAAVLVLVVIKIIDRKKKTA